MALHFASSPSSVGRLGTLGDGAPPCASAGSCREDCCCVDKPGIVSEPSTRYASPFLCAESAERTPACYIVASGTVGPLYCLQPGTTYLVLQLVLAIHFHLHALTSSASVRRCCLAANCCLIEL